MKVKTKGNLRIKDFVPAIVLSFCASFMLFLYEPITMYANNINDFWFDLYIMIEPTVLLAVFGFMLFILLFSSLWIISSLFTKNKLYQYILMFGFFCFVCAYIHSNFLAGFLPSLDGEAMNWGEPWANIMSVGICLVIGVAIIICYKKKGSQDTISYCSYVSLAILGMLAVSFATTFATTDVTKHKEDLAIITANNIDQASRDKNFMILLLDAVDSQHFNKIVSSNSEYQQIFKDFTYFPDTLSGYSFTRDSIPFIFSGEWNENKMQFADYSTQAFDNSAFFNALSEKQYSKNFYDYDIVWNSSEKLKFDNIKPEINGPKNISFIKQELKYILFKNLPYPFKRFSRIDSMDFAETRPEENLFAWDNVDFYHQLDNPIVFEDNKYFQYVHLEGGHVPFNVDEDLNIIDADQGTYPQKLAATIKVVDKYLSRLKNAEIYDNSVIIIMADHGFWYEGTNRQNPILYIKGINDSHQKTVVSDKQVSYVDLCETFIELLDGKKTDDLFEKYGHSDRKRRYLDNLFNHEEHMIEYEQTGKAWDVNTLVPTGIEFDL